MTRPCDDCLYRSRGMAWVDMWGRPLLTRRKIPQRCNNVASTHYARQISHVKACNAFEEWDTLTASGEVRT